MGAIGGGSIAQPTWAPCDSNHGRGGRRGSSRKRREDVSCAPRFPRWRGHFPAVEPTQERAQCSRPAGRWLMFPTVQGFFSQAPCRRGSGHVACYPQERHPAARIQSCTRGGRSHRGLRDTEANDGVEPGDLTRRGRRRRVPRGFRLQAAPHPAISAPALSQLSAERSPGLRQRLRLVQRPGVNFPAIRLYTDAHSMRAS